MSQGMVERPKETAALIEIADMLRVLKTKSEGLSIKAYQAAEFVFAESGSPTEEGRKVNYSCFKDEATDTISSVGKVIDQAYQIICRIVGE